jgi:hypothetical protein
MEVGLIKKISCEEWPFTREHLLVIEFTSGRSSHVKAGHTWAFLEGIQKLVNDEYELIKKEVPSEEGFYDKAKIIDEALKDEE